MEELTVFEARFADQEFHSRMVNNIFISTVVFNNVLSLGENGHWVFRDGALTVGVLCPG